MLQEKMQKASDELEFEQARNTEICSRVLSGSWTVRRSIRMRLRTVTLLQWHRMIRMLSYLFSLIRQGKLLGREHFHMEADEESSKEEVLGAFVKQFYAGTPYLPGENLSGT